ncbi:Phenylalanine tRNA ligase, partial [Scytalidium lignicola]
MGKAKRQKLHNKKHKQISPSKALQNPNGSSIQKSGAEKPKPKPHKQAQHSAPTVPFSPSENILLIGEGDLSFARSLIEHHKCTNVTATVLEPSLAVLEEKYPQAIENVRVIEEGGGKVMYGVDAGKMKAWTKGKKGKEKEGIMDRIVFNFPHVGGKSTDVNRQVRYNQELLVSFFTHAISSLRPAPKPLSTTPPSIIVTLFTNPPYTLWNIRDLARHSGLAVHTSFRFQAAAYPGYRHARTLGVVKSKKGEGEGGWKGEEREARSYVFVRKEDGELWNAAANAGKRKRGEEESDSESDSENRSGEHSEAEEPDDWDEKK